MNQKIYNTVTGIVFLIIALLHLVRGVIGWPASIAGWNVPIWLSWIAVIVTGYLAYQGLRGKTVSVN